MGNNLFAPGQSITREQMATIFYRFAEITGYDRTYTESSYAAFSDTGSVSSYAEIPLKWATSQGILAGSGGKLDPKGTATRAQVAQIFLNFSKVSSGGPENPNTEEPENPDSNWWENYNPEYTHVTGKSAVDSQGGYYDYDLSNEIMDLINDLRVQNGLNELAYHPQIQEWASVRAEEASISFSHTRPDGTLYNTVGYFLGAENLAWITTRSNNADTLLNGWYDSIGHRMNMLNSSVKLGAISCYVKDGKIYAAHLFSSKPMYLFDSVI